MRLDLFLKSSRICPRRSVAQKLCDAGAVIVNGMTAKPAHKVKPGDQLMIRRRDKVLTFKVLSVPERSHTSKEAARGLSELISEVVVSAEE